MTQNGNNCVRAVLRKLIYQLCHLGSFVCTLQRDIQFLAQGNNRNLLQGFELVEVVLVSACLSLAGILHLWPLGIIQYGM